jgi:hypothetical protein
MRVRPGIRFEDMRSPKPPIAFADVPDSWLADVRGILERDGQPVRAGASNDIEVKSLTSNRWGRLMLPGSGFEFVSAEDRDKILARLAEKQFP